jgi:hypothetical protein
MRLTPSVNQIVLFGVNLLIFIVTIIIIKTLLLMTLLMKLINVTLHICSSFTVIIKLYKYHKVLSKLNYK